MNTTQRADNTSNFDRYADALRLNQAALKEDLNATKDTLQETIKLQQEVQTDLLDRVALLKARLKDSEKETARAKADLDASRVATAALARQLTSQQEELAQLRLQLQEKNKDNLEILKLFGTLVNKHNRYEFLHTRSYNLGGLMNLPEWPELMELERTLPITQKECEEFLKKHPGALKIFS